jgi:hypothetical protein
MLHWCWNLLHSFVTKHTADANLTRLVERQTYMGQNIGSSGNVTAEVQQASSKVRNTCYLQYEENKISTKTEAYLGLKFCVHFSYPHAWYMPCLTNPPSLCYPIILICTIMNYSRAIWRVNIELQSNVSETLSASIIRVEVPETPRIHITSTLIMETQSPNDRL